MKLQHSRLALLLLLAVGTLGAVAASTLNVVHDDVPDSALESVEEQAEPIASVHISTPKVRSAASTASATAATTNKKSEPTPIAHKPTDEETLAVLYEASKHNQALADDLKAKKILPAGIEHSKAVENMNRMNQLVFDDNNDDYDDDDDDDDDEDDDDDVDGDDDEDYSYNDNYMFKKDDAQREAAKSAVKTPDSKNTSEAKQSEKFDYDSDEEDEYDDVADNEVNFSDDQKCPRYCECARNYIGYKVATCNRLDLGIQIFGSDISDLIVTNVSPKYPIVLSPKFFLRIGLRNVASINFDNCTIQDMHLEAFHGLPQLYSLNLTDVGLQIFNPESFATNHKLRLLTISGNDLNAMSAVPYLVNSSSLEELDLSRNNLVRLDSEAFTRLPNLVSLNLADNKLSDLPANVFDSLPNLEELDLSYNSLAKLPTTIFKRTSLYVLHLKYNAITEDLSFGSSDLQQLDLSYNSILHLQHRMLENMTGLTSLNLRGNGISKIQQNTFDTLSALRTLDLSVNELRQVSSLLFLNNPELSVVRLNDNPNLSELPTDGFRTATGKFAIYLLDLSNCAIGSLGYKTFARMSHLVTLRLAWNNINNLNAGTFDQLEQLTELDLSNNLIKRLDPLLLANNRELVKLNLAGNALSKLSPRLFANFTKLRELDVSDCYLTGLFNGIAFSDNYKFLSTLQVINISHNDITTMRKSQVVHFKNLRVFDITHNPLRCDAAFKDFISYVTLNTKISLSPVNTLAKVGDSEWLPFDFETRINWNGFATDICKKKDAGLAVTEANKTNEQEKKDEKTKEEKELDNHIDKVDKELASDSKSLSELIQKSKMEKIMKDSRPHTGRVVVTDEHDGSDYDEYDEEERLDEDEDGETDKDGDDDDDDSYDEREMAGNRKALEELFEKQRTMNSAQLNEAIRISINKPIVPADGSRVHYINDNIKLDGDESKEDEEERNDSVDNDGDFEEIILQHGRIYYRDYKSSLAAIALLMLILALLLLIIRTAVVIMRKRGERYRMALLAHSNNSFVYQKLSEDIVKPKPNAANIPNVHGYKPLQPV